MLGENHLTLLAQPYEKRLPLLILEDCVQLFDGCFLGRRQPVSIHVLRGMLDMEYIDGKSLKKYKVDSL